MGLNVRYLKAGRNSESDECLTPRYAVLPIVKHLVFRGYWNIWCPFDHDDSMYVRVLRQHGFNVVNTHIQKGQDFFETEPPAGVNCIISNPPFSCKDKVLRRLYDLKIPFGVLLPQNSLQAIGRVNMFMENGLEYLGFDRRICFYTNGNLTKWNPSNHFASGYFCHNLLHKPLIMECLQPIQEAYY